MRGWCCAEARHAAWDLYVCQRSKLTRLAPWHETKIEDGDPGSDLPGER